MTRRRAQLSLYRRSRLRDEAHVEDQMREMQAAAIDNVPLEVVASLAVSVLDEMRGRSAPWWPHYRALEPTGRMIFERVFIGEPANPCTGTPGMFGRVPGYDKDGMPLHLPAAGATVIEQHELVGIS